MYTYILYMFVCICSMKLVLQEFCCAVDVQKDKFRSLRAETARRFPGALLSIPSFRFRVQQGLLNDSVRVSFSGSSKQLR